MERNGLDTSTGVNNLNWSQISGEKKWLNQEVSPALQEQGRWYKPQRDMVNGAPIIAPKSMNEMYKTFLNQNKRPSLRLEIDCMKYIQFGKFVDELHALMQSTFFSFMLELGAIRD